MTLPVMLISVGFVLDLAGVVLSTYNIFTYKAPPVFAPEGPAIRFLGRQALRQKIAVVLLLWGLVLQMAGYGMSIWWEPCMTSEP